MMDNNYMYGDIKDDGMLLVSQKRYEELLEQEAWLLALENAGVDNWDGIDFARELFNEANEEEGEEDA